MCVNPPSAASVTAITVKLPVMPSVILKRLRKKLLLVNNCLMLFQ